MSYTENHILTLLLMKHIGGKIFVADKNLGIFYTQIY